MVVYDPHRTVQVASWPVIGLQESTAVPRSIFCASGAGSDALGTPEDPVDFATAISGASSGDQILLYPGSYTLTAAQALNDARVYIGPIHHVPGQQNIIVTTATADINLFDVTKAGVVIEGLRFTNSATVTTPTEMIDIDAGGDQCLIKDCVFDFADAANVEGINIATGVSDVSVIGCKFILPNAGESCIVHAGSQTHIEKCVFDLSGGDGLALEQASSPGDGMIVRDCIFMADGTDTVMMSWQASPGAGHAIIHNYVVDNNGDADCFGDDGDLDRMLIENYNGAADGSSVVIDPSVT